jgi:hydroxypyruvate isomerase
MNYKAIAASLDAIDYAGWVSIEAHDNETDLLPLVDDWLGYLRRSWSE